MKVEGPPLEALLRRLAECPEDFLRRPDPGHGEGIDVAAIVCDQLRAVAPEPPPEADAVLLKTIRGADARTRRLMAIAAWLLSDPSIARTGEPAAGMRGFYRSRELAQMAGLVKPEAAVQDPDRREELARLALRALGLRPLGESVAQATDRLNTLDSAERQRVLKATAEAEKRAREIREAMARQAAADAANRYGE